MKSDLTCDKCGAPNKLGRVFCGKCGERLNLTGFRPGFQNRRAGSRMLSAIKRMVRLILLTALLVLLAALLWPLQPDGREGERDQAELMYHAILDFEESIRRGERAILIVREEEINAYLNALVAHMDELAERDPFQLETRNINVSFTPEYVFVHILNTWGPLRLSYEAVGKPYADESGASMEIKRLSMGRVPVPAPFRNRLAMRLSRIFEEMDRELFILRHVTRVDMRDQVVRLITE